MNQIKYVYPKKYYRSSSFPLKIKNQKRELSKQTISKCKGKTKSSWGNSTVPTGQAGKPEVS